MMGLFNRAKAALKMSHAAVVVQNLLEHQAKCGLFDLNPAACANELVSAVWQGKPDVFSGRYGQWPHKISTAAIALAVGVKRMKDGNPNRNAVLLALGTVLAEVERNGNLYPFTRLDEQLLESAVAVFTEAAATDEAEHAEDYEALRKMGVTA